MAYECVQVCTCVWAHVCLQHMCTLPQEVNTEIKFELLIGFIQLNLVDNTGKYQGFPDSSAGKESACNAGDLGSIPGLGRSPGEGKGYPLQYSGLENSMDCIVYRVTKSWTRMSDFHSSFNTRNGILEQRTSMGRDF